MIRMKRFLAASAAFGVSALLVVACSGTDDPGSDFGSTSNDGVGGDPGGGAGGSGEDSGGSDPNPGNGNDGGTGLLDVSTGSDATVNADTACVNVVADGEQQPVDIFIMLDKSGSMVKNPDESKSLKWDAVVNGLTQFVHDPSTAGMGVGLQYFALPQGGGGTSCPALCDSTANSGACSACGGSCVFGFCAPGNFGGGGDSCEVADYSKAEIPIAPLPGNAEPISQSLKAQSPVGGTPTGPALAGAIQYASSWQAQHPDHKTVVLLATDGDPQECKPRDMKGIADIAADGHKNGIDTYVIGMAGATMQWLNAWAAAGGTGKAYDASDPTKFVEQMNAIRGTAMSCTYGVPAPDAGKVDYKNVTVTAKVSGGQQLVPPVAKADACGSSDGWYYDDPDSPKTITLCPHTCDTLQSAGNAGIELNLGCVTHGPF